MNYSLGNTLSRGGSLNADGLSLDLQFATDKTLTARKGPTPVFTRASNATYYGPLVDFAGETYPTTGIVDGRAEWKIVDGSDYKSFGYAGGAWRYTEFFSSEGTTFDSAATSAFRPEQADWSASGLAVFPTTSSTFGIVRSAINEPRFDHATTAPNACLGLLIEESRTNLVFPSATLTTQTRTVTAVAHTLSFYGTGTIVLSGAHVATVTGTGAFPTRTTLTFTPSAGSLTLTVTGTVTEAQLEAGAVVTSYIPTTTASVVRSADVCSITGSDFTGMYNASEGTWCPSLFQGVPSSPFAPLIEPSGSGPLVNLFGNFVSCGINNIFGFNYPTALVQNVKSNIAFGYKSGDFAVTVNGGAMATSADTRMGSAIVSVTFGRRNAATINGHIHSIRYYKKRLANAKLQTLTT
jgi:hypothetical protein